MPTKSLTIREDSDVIIVDVNSDLGSYEAAELRRGLQELIGQEAEKHGALANSALGEAFKLAPGL